MTLPDTITMLRQFWFNRTERTKWIIVLVIAFILYLI